MPRTTAKPRESEEGVARASEQEQAGAGRLEPPAAVPRASDGGSGGIGAAQGAAEPRPSSARVGRPEPAAAVPRASDGGSGGIGAAQGAAEPRPSSARAPR